MRALTAAELLSIWERGIPLGPPARALALLEAACPESSPAELAGMPLGRRDARLMRLREAVFGPRLNALATCDACGERVELEFSAGDLMAAPDRGENGPEAFDVTVRGYELSLRLPTGEDLSVAAGAGSLSAARQTLIERCVRRAGPGGEPLSNLPDDVIAEAARRLAEADPQADVKIDLTCPACEAPWQETFSILPFFWAEIQGWAARLLREVHELARAYGWREADILALSPWRRQAYLEMLAGTGA